MSLFGRQNEENRTSSLCRVEFIALFLELYGGYSKRLGGTWKTDLFVDNFVTDEAGK